MNKTEIAGILTEIGTLLELKGENPFKVRAYQSGARVVESLEESDLHRRIADGSLEDVKGIGEALAQKITELQKTGQLEFYTKLKASIAPGLVELLQIPGMGPKKIRALQEKLGIESIAALQKACEEGRIATLDGFGEKSQTKILEGIRNREKYGRRHLWIEAWTTAEPILMGLRTLPQVLQAEHAGSLRRRMETVGDLDFLVATTDPKPVADWFVAQPGVKEVTAQGETKASVRLESGLQADLRLVPPEQFAFALHHFTGSKDHNVQMRQRALGRGLSLSEWGLVAAEGEGTVKKKAEDLGRKTDVKSEADLFRALGLSFIPPELREGLGEIEAAEQEKLPGLVQETEIRGVFHNHTTASDGHNTLEEMTAAAQVLGLEYLGIADHSKSSFQARGLTEDRLREQIATIRQLNASKKFSCWIFAGSEVDILPDGRLDFGDDLLGELDYIVASVHSAFSQDRETMTNRIVRAIEHPRTTMLGHLTGRLLLQREGYGVDVDRIVDAAIAHQVVIELNANPMRLDMDWRHWRKAAEKGLLTSINPDAHSIEQLAFYRLGVSAARKAWLTPPQVLNTLPRDEMAKWLARRRG